MKIKLDENMPAGLAEILVRLGHDVETVPQEGLAGCSDPDIWSSAQREGRFLITQDLDFSDIHRFSPGTHHGLLLVRLRTPGRLALTSPDTRTRAVCQAWEPEPTSRLMSGWGRSSSWKKTLDMASS
jgi:hypothetical protein